MATEILLWLKVLVARLATMATEGYWQKEAQYSIYHQRASKTNLFHMRGGRYAMYTFNKPGTTDCLHIDSVCVLNPVI